MNEIFAPHGQSTPPRKYQKTSYITKDINGKHHTHGHFKRQCSYEKTITFTII